MLGFRVRVRVRPLRTRCCLCSSSCRNLDYRAWTGLDCPRGGLFEQRLPPGPRLPGGRKTHSLLGRKTGRQPRTKYVGFAESLTRLQGRGRWRRGSCKLPKRPRAPMMRRIHSRQGKCQEFRKIGKLAQFNHHHGGAHGNGRNASTVVVRPRQVR